MKKIILAALLAVMANAGAIVGVNVGYSNVDATATVNGTEGTATSKSKSYQLNAGYDFGEVRVTGYYQYEAYSDDLLLIGEGNQYSLGVNVDYHGTIDEQYGYLLGGQLGRGTKDLGSNGDVIGIPTIDFVDIGVKAALLVEFGEIELETGVKYTYRRYQDIVYGTNTLETEDGLFGAYIGANYKF